MIATLHKRNRQLALRLALALLAFVVLGVTLALLLRTNQSRQALRDQHARILANLPLMQTETATIQQQMADFRRTLPAGLGSRSPELTLYARLDEIKRTLQPLEMTVTTPESKDGVLSIGFNLKLPLARYNALVNGMGQLQTTLIPFVDFRELSLDAKTAEGAITVVGNVVLPTMAGGTP
jgi:hypothetical protein